MRLGLAGAGLLTILALPQIAARAAEADDIAQKVQSAKTPADHEALAAFYDQQASAAKSKAEEHRRMGEFYKGTAMPKGLGTSSMPQHCDALVKSFEAQARELAAMAEVHRQLAKSVK
jgi:hypothetical protein